MFTKSTTFFMFFLMAGANIANAATLTQSKTSTCTYEFSGKIEAGDERKFQKLINAGKEIEKVCLNSPGGSYKAAIKLTDIFMDNGIATHIRKSDTCLSACAVAFLGGSVWGDRRHVSRQLEPGGKLGFHAPYIEFSKRDYSSTELEKAYKLALSIASDLVERKSALKLGDEFIRTFILKYDKTHMNMVQTVEDAIVTNLQIISKLSSIGFKEVSFKILCYNLFQLYKTSFVDLLTAKAPYHQIKSDEFARVRFVNNMENGVAGHYTVYTKHDAETYTPSSACAIAKDLGSVYLWTNEFMDDVNFSNSERHLQVSTSPWMAYPPSTLIEKIR